MKFMKKILASLIIILLLMGYIMPNIANAATSKSNNQDENWLTKTGKLVKLTVNPAKGNEFLTRIGNETKDERDDKGENWFTEAGNWVTNQVNGQMGPETIYYIYPKNRKITTPETPTGTPETPTGTPETPTGTPEGGQPVIPNAYTTGVSIDNNRDENKVEINVELDNISNLQGVIPTLELKINSDTIELKEAETNGNTLKYTLQLQDKYFKNNKTNDVNPLYVNDIYGENLTNSIPNDQPICTLKTVHATGVDTELTKGGNYKIKVKFDNAEGGGNFRNTVEPPQFNVKIGGIPNEFKFDVATKESIKDNYLLYSTNINDMNLMGQKVIFDSLKSKNEKDFIYEESDAICKIDFESKMPKELFTIDNFILVDVNQRGDINKDARIDKLDVEELKKATKSNPTALKKIADLNGNNEIESYDVAELNKAIQNAKNENALMYVNFINIGFIDTIRGDVCKYNGSTTKDGILNYKDVEEIEKRFANRQAYSQDADVNHDGKVDTNDITALQKALITGNELYLYSVKVQEGKNGDFNNDGYVDYKDIFEIYEFTKDDKNKYDKKYDINGDGKIDTRDQSYLYSKIANGDMEYFATITVPITSNGTKGDVNQDGFINMSDVYRMEATLNSEINNGESIGLNVLDVNDDGCFDKVDVYALKDALKNVKNNSFNIDNGRLRSVLRDGYCLVADENGNGDINEDGYITIDDARIIASLLATQKSWGDYSKEDLNLQYVSFVRSDLEADDVKNAIEILNKGLSTKKWIYGKDKNGKDKQYNSVEELENELGFSLDINNDNTISVKDLTGWNQLKEKAKEARMEYESQFKDNIKKGDYNGDGKTDVRDASQIYANLVNTIRDKGSNVKPGADPSEIRVTNEILYGDADCNGYVELADIIKIAKYNLNNNAYPLIYEIKDEDGNPVLDSDGNPTYNNIAFIQADVTGDGKVDTLDLSKMIEMNLGAITYKDLIPKGGQTDEN